MEELKGRLSLLRRNSNPLLLWLQLTHGVRFEMPFIINNMHSNDGHVHYFIQSVWVHLNSSTQGLKHTDSEGALKQIV